jgi:hypothetical protein
MKKVVVPLLIGTFYLIVITIVEEFTNFIERIMNKTLLFALEHHLWLTSVC